MILQALYEYYHRKAADPDNNLAPEGWEWKEIPYVIVIDHHGKFVAIEETHTGEGRSQRARKFLVPQSVKRTSGKAANLLWDNLEYALGANPRGREDIGERHQLFIQRIKNEINVEKVPTVKNLLHFLENDPIHQIEMSSYNKIWKKMLKENPFIVFKIDGYYHSSICDDIKEEGRLSKTEEAVIGVCLITGKTGVQIERLHPAIKGVKGASSQGAALVSFNHETFNSFGKTKNYNAPISKEATFAYTTALNILLGKDSQNKITLADTTITFWAEKKSDNNTYDLESTFPWFFKDKRDDPDRNIEAVRCLYEAIYKGQLTQSSERFYVLALAPNKTRISVRFFRQGTVRDFGENIKMHFDDFEIVRRASEPEYLTLEEILASVSMETRNRNKPNVLYFKGKYYDVIPNLASAVIESYLDGTPYPMTLLHQCISRIRAEVSKKDKKDKQIQNFTRTRAAILKATINRFNRIYKPNEKEILMALDESNTKPGYLLGRLFAVLEKIQEEAQPGINTTIRDRFYASASTSPLAVFSRLVKLSHYHLPKLNAGRRVNLEKLIGDIMANISEFPAYLTLNDQALFAIGYYHQRQDLFTSKKEQNDTN